MREISFSDAKENLAEAMQNTVEDGEPVLITHRGGASCVLISLKEFNALEETAYLLKSPKNARRLMNSIDSLRQAGHSTIPQGKLNAEIAKAIDTSGRLARQPMWYPLLLSAGLISIVAALTALLVR